MVFIVAPTDYLVSSHSCVFHCDRVGKCKQKKS